MKTFKTALGFEYDLEVTAVSRDSIDYVVYTDEGDVDFINQVYDNQYSSKREIELFNSGDLDKDDLIEDIQQFEEIEKIVNEMMLAARN